MYEFWQSQAQDQDATHLTQAKKTINLGIKKLETIIGMPPLEEERSILTTTSDSYALPERFIKLNELYVTVSSTRYYADHEYSDEAWGRFKRQSSATSDMLRSVFVRPGLHTFEIYPTPATAGNTMKLIYHAFSKDLTAANYITGTITTLANLGTAITFSGTTLTASMVGRWILLPDGNWYKLATFTDTTHMSIQQQYQGSEIVAGTETYIIGEIPRIPVGTHELPVYYALWQYYQGIKRDKVMAAYYKNLWDEGSLQAKADFGGRYTSAVIPSQRARLKASRSINISGYPDLSSLE